MLLAMQASRLLAPAASARASTSTWTWGVMVAQLMKVVPAASARRLSPLSLNTSRMDESSVTTVMTTSEAAVTAARLSGAWQSSSPASASARPRCAS